MTTAYYFDGVSARLHTVDLTAGSTGLGLRGAVERDYPLAGTTLAEPFAGTPAVLYFPDGARCEVPSPAAGAALAGLLGYRKPLAVRWQERIGAALACLVLLVLLLAATVQWGIPAATEHIAAALPEEVDRTLGTSALSALEHQGLLLPSRFSEQRVARLEALLESVAPGDKRLRLLVRDAPQLGPNAMALPDGSIVLTDQMVRMVIGKGDLTEEAAAALAGILAHEAGHVRLRHSARSLTRASLTAALSATLFGDFSAVAAGAPALLMDLKFSRAMELEADDHGLKLMLERGIPVEPLAALFETFGEDEPEDGWIDVTAGYISTHPASHERAQRLREAAGLE
ncbi:M48 family metallopeptidase [Massilia sp. DD77]|uniref:M48 family metallopeptidase n=1 Tax=Massilia sp. DD77 TaxID=3109349 RepID=UPI002FFDD528